MKVVRVTLDSTLTYIPLGSVQVVFKLQVYWTLVGIGLTAKGVHGASGRDVRGRDKMSISDKLAARAVWLDVPWAWQPDAHTHAKQRKRNQFNISSEWKHMCSREKTTEFGQLNCFQWTLKMRQKRLNTHTNYNLACFSPTLLGRSMSHRLVSTPTMSILVLTPWNRLQLLSDLKCFFIWLCFLSPLGHRIIPHSS